MRIRGLAPATALFFLSGATGLAYEVIWFRRFSHIWGATTLAMAAVVASFLLGLGIGAHFLGRVADRVRSPLKGYAICEAAIAVLALLIPLECSLLSTVSGALYPALSGHPILYTTVRFLLTFLVIGPPCILMGGTFPLLVRQFAGQGAVGPIAGWLYAVNTVGAAVGCYLAGFHLLPMLGLSGTNTLAASLNGAIAGVAFLLARPLEQPAPLPSAELPTAPAPRAGALYAAAALTGLSALLLQMVWTRQLCVMLGGSTYALTSTLVVILLGIGLGSLLFRAVVDRIPDPARAAAWSLGLLVLSAGATRLLVHPLTVAVGLSGSLRSLGLGNAAVCLGASAALELIPSICMGFNFPLLVHLTRRRAADAGRTVGTVYAWNTAGSILGAAATAPLGLALLGSARTLAVGLVLYTIAALLLLPFRGRRNLIALAGLVAPLRRRRLLRPPQARPARHRPGDVSLRLPRPRAAPGHLLQGRRVVQRDRHRALHRPRPRRQRQGRRHQPGRHGHAAGHRLPAALPPSRGEERPRHRLRQRHHVGREPAVPRTRG